MSDMKLTWKEMTPEERAIFGSRATAPILTVLACAGAIAVSFVMLYAMQGLWL
jgi:hypothetical protein